jgi:hypothetical protein
MASQCLLCPIGQFCPGPGSVTWTICGPAFFANTTGQSVCTPCPLGTYNPTNVSGRSTVCPDCLAGYYCPTALRILQCPNNTNSSAGGGSIYSCLCDPGYVCGYFKTVQVTFALVNVTMSDFNGDVNGVQTNFIASVASAAGVEPAAVTIVSVSSFTPTSRRLLRMEYSQPLKPINHGGLSIVVHIDPPSSPHLANLEAHADYDGHRVIR